MCLCPATAPETDGAACGTFQTLRPFRRRLAWTALVALVLTVVWACAPADNGAPPAVTPAAVPAQIEIPPTAPTTPQPAPATALPTSAPVETPSAVAAQREPAAAMSAVPAPAPTATPSPAATQQAASQLAPELAALVADIGPKVAASRGLEPWDVPALLMTPEEFKGWLPAKFEEESSAEEIASDQLEWELLGLIRPEQSLYELQLALYTEQAAGFYDSESEEIVIIGVHDVADLQLIATLAHEYVHALQDRAFDLDALEDSIDDNQDALIALRALVEGDATVASIQYVERAMRRQELAKPSSAGRPPNDGFSKSPAALQAILVFPYVAGQTYVAALLGDGWKAVDAAYARLPASTEQVLHPEKYAANEAPLQVDLPALTGVLPAGWSEVRRDVLGEFMVSLILGGGFVRPAAAGAAAGWGGDAYALYRNQVGLGLMTMKFRWDTEHDLDEFWTVMVDHLGRGGLGSGVSEVDTATATWRGDGRTAHAQRLADSVLLIIGHDAAVVRVAADFLARS